MNDILLRMGQVELQILVHDEILQHDPLVPLGPHYFDEIEFRLNSI